MESMRANPWHLRLPTIENYQWYKNLVDQHELTECWLKEVQNDRPSHLLTRGLSSEITENLWMLESISKIELHQMIDDTQVEDMLGRLEHTIWAVQSWTLNALISHSTSATRNALDALLDQLSWKMGKISVESRWKKHTTQKQQDLRQILLCLKDSPFSGYPHVDGFLIKRASEKEVQIELRACPHQIHYRETKPIADRLCRLHTQWMKGFAYGLNSRISVEHVIQSPRCIQKWFFI